MSDTGSNNYGKITGFHIATLLCEIATIILNLLLYRSWKFQKHYLKKECGVHIKFIVIVSIFCGVSSMPYQFMILAFNNENCPLLLLVLLALPRIFTARFEVIQYTGIALDRACATLTHSIYHKYIRMLTFKISMGTSLVISIIDSVLFFLHDDWVVTVDTCSIGSISSDLFKNYFFTVNIICLGILMACSMFYTYDYFHFNTNSVSTQIVYKLAMLMLIAFVILFGVPNIILCAGRLTRIDFSSILGTYGDFFMQLQHVVVFFLFTCIVTPKKLSKVTTVTSSTSPQILPHDANPMHFNTRSTSVDSSKNGHKNNETNLNTNPTFTNNAEI